MHRLTYRPDIDGLRAIAVLGVLFFHAGLGCQGGFLGVDVFFVISGFLITSLILRDLRQGTFSFVDFWARRIRRIVPALAVMTLGVIVVGYFGMFPDYYEALGKQVIALVLCVSNVKFWRETGYFDTASDEKPLLHTWSLSVEEQFYFIIPIALFLIFRFKREKLALPLIVLTCGVSFTASVYASVHHPSANFYLLPTRAWELGVGSLLAFAGPIKNQKLREFSSFIGLALIIGCYYLFPKGVSFPGASALPPVLGAALLIWSGIGQDHLPAINRFLTLKPIVGIGLISYSLYLLHWPIFAYQKHLGYSAYSHAVQFSLLVISFLPAWLSWKYIETPFRKKTILRTQREIIQFGGLTITTFLVFGGLAWNSQGTLGRFNESKLEVLIRSTRVNQEEEFQLGVEGRVDFILWGDSHAKALANTFDEKAKELGFGGIAMMKNGTPPLINVTRLDKKLPLNNANIEKIIQLKPTAVFLVSRWATAINGRPKFDVENEGKSKTDTLIKHSSISHFSHDNARKSLKLSLEETAYSLNKIGIKALVIKDTPQLDFNPLDYVKSKTFALSLRRKDAVSDDLNITLDAHHQWQSNANQIIDEICEKSSLLIALSIDEQFFPNGRPFKPYNNKGSFYFDDDHLNDFGANLILGDQIEEWLQEAIR